MAEYYIVVSYDQQDSFVRFHALTPILDDAKKNV